MTSRTMVVLGVLAALSVPAAWAEMGDMGMSKKKPSSSEAAPMKDRCRQMGEMRRAMHAKMTARQEKLDELVAAMKKAEGSAKVDATAAVVEELVSQRKAMHEHMGKMGAMMKGGKSGGMGMMPMGDCPMMDPGSEATTESGEPEDHSEHHPDPE